MGKKRNEPIPQLVRDLIASLPHGENAKLAAAVNRSAGWITQVKDGKIRETDPIVVRRIREYLETLTVGPEPESPPQAAEGPEPSKSVIVDIHGSGGAFFHLLIPVGSKVEVVWQPDGARIASLTVDGRAVVSPGQVAESGRAGKRGIRYPTA